MLARRWPTVTGKFPGHHAFGSNFALPCVLLACLFAGAVCAADPAAEAYRAGDYATAVAAFERGVAVGDAAAANNLGVMYLKGRGVDIDYVRARELFETAAADGIAGAMFNRGIMLLRGYGGPPEPARAHGWFERAARLGDREAQFFLGLMLTRGDGVPADPEAAREWFRQSAEAGLAASQFNLAMLLLSQDVEDNEDEALRWLSAASAQAHPGAALQIAQLHLRHADNPERTARAAAILRPLAEDGSAEGQLQLGMMYSFGGAHVLDHEEGRFWLRQAALQDLPAAQFNLATIYARGIGTEPDPVRAWAWFDLAAPAHPQAGAARDLVAAELDVAAIERATALAEELRRVGSRGAATATP